MHGEITCDLPLMIFQALLHLFGGRSCFFGNYCQYFTSRTCFVLDGCVGAIRIQNNEVERKRKLSMFISHIKMWNSYIRKKNGWLYVWCCKQNVIIRKRNICIITYEKCKVTGFCAVHLLVGYVSNHKSLSKFV